MGTSQARTRLQRQARQREGELRRAIAMEIRHQREDAGHSAAAVARTAEISPAEYSRIEAGLVSPPLETLVRICIALGGDLSLRFLPGLGVPIRDRFQAPMIEALIAILHERWKRIPEVPVQRPVRGVIDLVLHDPDEPIAIATEAQSQIRRVEQQLRWQNLKAEALQAGTNLPLDGARVSRLLLLRDTPPNRKIVDTFADTFRAAYPADPEAAEAALRTTDPWPGATLLWTQLDGSTTRIKPTLRRRRLPH